MCSKSDEFEYLVDGLISGASSRRVSVMRLVELCASPHSRFMLRLSGGLPRLLEALSVAEEVAVADEAVRLCLAVVAFTLLQDRANVEIAGGGALRGLIALVQPLAESRTSDLPSASGAVASGGWRKRIALGGKADASQEKREHQV